jgi:hypothetical protein
MSEVPVTQISPTQLRTSLSRRGFLRGSALTAGRASGET